MFVLLHIAKLAPVFINISKAFDALPLASFHSMEVALLSQSTLYVSNYIVSKFTAQFFVVVESLKLVPIYFAPGECISQNFSSFLVLVWPFEDSQFI